MFKVNSNALKIAGMNMKRLNYWSSESLAMNAALLKSIADGCPDCKALYHALRVNSAYGGCFFGVMFGLGFSIATWPFGTMLPFGVLWPIFVIVPATVSGRIQFWGIDIPHAESLINQSLGNGANAFAIRIINHKWYAEYASIAHLNGAQNPEDIHVSGS